MSNDKKGENLTKPTNQNETPKGRSVEISLGMTCPPPSNSVKPKIVIKPTDKK